MLFLLLKLLMFEKKKQNSGTAIVDSDSVCLRGGLELCV